MNAAPARTPQSQPTVLVVPRKEIRRMPFNLSRFLDGTASITVVFLALYVGGATALLGL